MDSQSTDQAGKNSGLLDAPEGCPRKTEDMENFPPPQGETRMKADCGHPPENFPDPQQGQTRDIAAKARRTLTSEVIYRLERSRQLDQQSQQKEQQP